MVTLPIKVTISGADFKVVGTKTGRNLNSDRASVHPAIRAPERSRVSGKSRLIFSFSGWGGGGTFRWVGFSVVDDSKAVCRSEQCCH